MQKIAQERGILNKLREFTHLPGRAFEGASSDFENIMNDLRDNVDDPVRAIISGKQIGNASPSEEISLKDLLKSAKTHIGKREYMTAVSELSRFHKSMNDVVNLLKQFSSNIDKTHEKFLFDTLDDETKKHLHDLKERLKEQKKASADSFLIKEADILDFVMNALTERGRALAAWEKRYPKQIGKLKKDTASMLNSSERLLMHTLSVLKVLATARATRNPDKYIEAAQKIIRVYDSYDKSFKEYYNTNIKNFLEKQESNAPMKIDTSKKPLEIGKQEVNVPSKTVEQEPLPMGAGPTPVVGPPSGMESGPVRKELSPEIPPPPPMPTGIKLPQMPSVPKPPTPPQKPLFPELKPGEAAVGGKPRQPTAEELKLPLKPPTRKAHQQFMESLECMADENPIVLANHIIQYAKSIQATDVETSIKLFKLAKSIKG